MSEELIKRLTILFDKHEQFFKGQSIGSSGNGFARIRLDNGKIIDAVSLNLTSSNNVNVVWDKDKNIYYAWTEDQRREKKDDIIVYRKSRNRPIVIFYPFKTFTKLFERNFRKAGDNDFKDIVIDVNNLQIRSFTNIGTTEGEYIVYLSHSWDNIYRLIKNNQTINIPVPSNKLNDYLGSVVNKGLSIFYNEFKQRHLNPSLTNDIIINHVDNTQTGGNVSYLPLTESRRTIASWGLNYYAPDGFGGFVSSPFSTFGDYSSDLQKTTTSNNNTYIENSTSRTTINTSRSSLQQSTFSNSSTLTRYGSYNKGFVVDNNIFTLNLESDEEFEVTSYLRNYSYETSFTQTGTKNESVTFGHSEFEIQGMRYPNPFQIENGDWLTQNSYSPIFIKVSSGSGTYNYQFSGTTTREINDTIQYTINIVPDLQETVLSRTIITETKTGSTNNASVSLTPVSSNLDLSGFDEQGNIFPYSTTNIIRVSGTLNRTYNETETFNIDYEKIEFEKLIVGKNNSVLYGRKRALLNSEREISFTTNSTVTINKSSASGTRTGSYVPSSTTAGGEVSYGERFLNQGTPRYQSGVVFTTNIGLPQFTEEYEALLNYPKNGFNDTLIVNDRTPSRFPTWDKFYYYDGSVKKEIDASNLFCLPVDNYSNPINVDDVITLNVPYNTYRAMDLLGYDGEAVSRTDNLKTLNRTYSRVDTFTGGEPTSLSSTRVMGIPTINKTSTSFNYSFFSNLIGTEVCVVLTINQQKYLVSGEITNFTTVSTTETEKITPLIYRPNFSVKLADFKDPVTNITPTSLEQALENNIPDVRESYDYFSLKYGGTIKSINSISLRVDQIQILPWFFTNNVIFNKDNCFNLIRLYLNNIDSQLRRINLVNDQLFISQNLTEEKMYSDTDHYCNVFRIIKTENTVKIVYSDTVTYTLTKSLNNEEDYYDNDWVSYYPPD